MSYWCAVPDRLDRVQQDACGGSIPGEPKPKMVNPSYLYKQLIHIIQAGRVERGCPRRGVSASTPVWTAQGRV